MLTPKEFNTLRVVFNNMQFFQGASPTGMPTFNISRDAVLEILEKYTDFDPPIRPKEMAEFKDDLAKL